MVAYPRAKACLSSCAKFYARCCGKCCGKKVEEKATQADADFEEKAALPNLLNPEKVEETGTQSKKLEASAPAVAFIDNGEEVSKDKYLKKTVDMDTQMVDMEVSKPEPDKYLKEMVDMVSWFGEPWSAKDLIQQRLAGYFRLARKSPLRYVHLVEALSHFADELGYELSREDVTRNDMRLAIKGLDKATFVNVTRKLLATKDMLDPLLPNEHDEAIGDVFDVSTCVSFRTGMSKGALVIGLTIFFQGAQQEKSQAVRTFSDHSGCLHLKDYLAPLIMAMTPADRMELLPLLVDRCAELMMDTVDLETADLHVKQQKLENKVLTYQEFGEWLSRYSVLDFVAKAVETTVYTCWAQSLQSNDIVTSL